MLSPFRMDGSYCGFCCEWRLRRFTVGWSGWVLQTSISVHACGTLVGHCSNMDSAIRSMVTMVLKERVLAKWRGFTVCMCVSGVIWVEVLWELRFHRWKLFQHKFGTNYIHMYGERKRKWKERKKKENPRPFWCKWDYYYCDYCGGCCKIGCCRVVLSGVQLFCGNDWLWLDHGSNDKQNNENRQYYYYLYQSEPWSLLTL